MRLSAFSSLSLAVLSVATVLFAPRAAWAAESRARNQASQQESPQQELEQREIGQRGESKQGEQTEVEELVQTIVTAGDSGAVEPIQRLANLKTPAALDALIQVFGKLDSVFMRRAVLQGVSLFDDVEGQNHRALQFLTDAATQLSDRELRFAAVDLIGRCRTLGRPFLALLVESSADDEVREEALRRHAGNPRESDAAWYLSLWHPQKASAGKKKRGRGKRKDEGETKTPQPRSLPVLREIAFEALVSDLGVEDVAAATADPNPKIRVRAIQELDARDDVRAEALLESLLQAVRARPEDRLFAAKALLAKRGAGFAEELIKMSTRKDQGEIFVLGVADLLSELDDAAVDKKILKKLGKGKGLERLFWLRAARDIENPKVDKALLKLIGDKDERVAGAALAIIGERKMFDARADLEKFVNRAEAPELVADALETLNVLRRGDPEWIEQLLAYADNTQRSVRNAAIQTLASIKDPRATDALIAALENEDWSTRLYAVKALKQLRKTDAVQPLIARLPREEGRLANAVADTLFSLTGQHYHKNAALWERWWKDAQEGFEVISTTELRKLAKQEDEQRLRQVTRTEFFGVKVESNSVVFILDVSGSMLEPTLGGYGLDSGSPRIEVAKHELLRVIDRLDRRSFFNLIVFSGRVKLWSDLIKPFDEESVLDAKGFVADLKAGGGTNLFGALKAAFDDPAMDTIYLLSDGEPSVGSVIDPGAIRDRVATWNKNRGVVIHSIAVGGSLEVLEWLAEDSGGKYVRIP